jgi:hypothetical protein
MRHQHEGIGRNHGDRHQVFDGIVGQLFEHGRADGERGIAEEQRVAIRRRLRHDIGGDIATCTGAIVDDGLLAQRGTEPLRGDAGDQVTATAGGKRQDNPDLPSRVLLGP